jgi:hypothetical protein
LKEPKAFFVAIRSMVSDEAFTANLSRAVVQFVRDCEWTSSDIEVSTFDELEVEGNFGRDPLWSISRVRFPRDTKHRSFLEHARRLDASGQTDFALDIIFDQIDEMLLAGQFDRANQLLIDTAIDEYSVELLLGILTATLPAKDRLPERAEFFRRVEETLRSRGELKDGLLVGLD